MLVQVCQLGMTSHMVHVSHSLEMDVKCVCIYIDIYGYINIIVVYNLYLHFYTSYTSRVLNSQKFKAQKGR